jgi:hypothetical protein
MQLTTALNNFISLYSANAETPSGNDYLGSGSAFGRKRMRRFFKNSNYLPFIIVGIVVVGLVIYLFTNVFFSSNVNQSGLMSEDQRVNVKSAKASQEFNKEFLFPLKDQSGKEVSKLKITLQNAELRDEIIVKGQRGTAVQGRTFLILNLKIVNEFDKPLEVKVRDYVRLIINNSPDKLAPEIHNDPVEVQAISTKYTRLGFPINDTDKNLVLQIGEIKGQKQTIKLNFR